MNAIMVSVDYADLLALTLPYNRHHFDRIMVVTSHADAANVFPVVSKCGAEILCTDLFYANGAMFNKWAALEWALDLYGRQGWLCLMDADVLWPKDIGALPDSVGMVLTRRSRTFDWQRGFLYTPLRYMADPIPSVVPPEELWHTFPLHPQQREWAGYTQIFHANDPVLGPPPWHQTDWTHAGGADSFFQAKWDAAHKIRPPFRVLHLGPAGQNWAGRTSAYLDGTLPPDAAARRAGLRSLLRRRGTRREGGDPFRHERLPPG